MAAVHCTTREILLSTFYVSSTGPEAEDTMNRVNPIPPWLLLLKLVVFLMRTSGVRSDWLGL